MNMKVSFVVSLLALVAAQGTFAQGVAPRESFLKQQAYAEMKRVSGQIDVLQASHDELAERVARMEGGKGEVGLVKADVAALRADIENVRREMNRMRQEIVADLTKKMTAIIKENAAAATPPSSRATPSQPSVEGAKIYTVQSGDSLFLIAQAFGTSVSKIKEMNGLQSDRLRIGQKLYVPKN